MPRSVWTGSLGFGLVNVPVKLYSATEDKDIHFRQFDANTGEPIHNVRVNERGDEVDYENINKGYEASRGHYIIVTPEELESVQPTRTRSIDIEDFVPLDEIDPVYFRTTYYLAPDDGKAAAKSYNLLRAAMEAEGRVGIARFVMRTKQHLATVRASDGVLVLETMFFGDEVREPNFAELDQIDKIADVDERELKMARQLIGSLSAEWDATRYADTYRERVLELIEKKAEGEEVVVEPRESAEATNVVDLMSVLEASLNQARSGSPETSADETPENDDGWGQRSKEELYEEAQRLDIAGRSQMSKQELVGAIRKAS